MRVRELTSRHRIEKPPTQIEKFAPSQFRNGSGIFADGRRRWCSSYEFATRQTVGDRLRTLNVNRDRLELLEQVGLDRIDHFFATMYALA